MADHTAIEWCDATLNLWWGCTKVSDGCKHCYAETLTNRYGRNNWGANGIRQEVKSWRSTLAKISKRAKSEGRRLRVFVQSMSDTFEGPETMGGEDSQNWKTVKRLLADLLYETYRFPELDFLILTKRPENVLKLGYRGWHQANGPDWMIPPNVWIGTSVEDQKTADERIPHLLRIPAAVRFLSCEPLLGPVSLEEWLGCFEITCPECGDNAPLYESDLPVNGICGQELEDGSECEGVVEAIREPSGIHWIICGGESGPKARPMDVAWVYSLKQQCEASNVPFFMKQLGKAFYHSGYRNGEDLITAGSKGSDWDHENFPDDLKIHEFPEVPVG